jgi:uncharacterized protein YjbJ (UPF0337 family)
MTHDAQNSTGRPAGSPEELRAEVEEARGQLADTVAEIAGRADIKAKAQQKAGEAKARVQQAADQSRSHPGPLAAVAGAVLLVAAALLWHRKRR